jgi:hypothetical protein
MGLNRFSCKVDVDILSNFQPDKRMISASEKQLITWSH